MTSQFNENVNLLSQVLRSSKHAGKRIAYTGKFNPVDGTLTASRDTIPDKNQAWVRLDPKGIAIPAWHNHKFDVSAIDLVVYVDYNPAGELEVTDLMNSDISTAYGSAASEVTTPQVIVKNNSTILKESIDILRPTRSGLGGLKVRVSGYLSPYGNFITQDVDFDGQQPSTSGVRRWAITYLDTTTLDVAFALGDETPANEATRNDIPSISLPRVAIPIAAMSMYDGMTQYVDSELVDIRPFLTLKGDDVIFYQLLLVDSIEMIQRNAIDFLSGSGIAIVGTDNPGDNSTEIEISLDIGLNAKGDLLTSDGDDLAILPVGANNSILTADDTTPSGLAYKNTIDGVTIGGTTPAAGTFTTLTGGNLQANENTLSSINTNGQIELIPNGSGNVRMQTNAVSVTGNTEDEFTYYPSTTSLQLSRDSSVPLLIRRRTTEGDVLNGYFDTTFEGALRIGSGEFGIRAATDLSFRTGGSGLERMRILSGGQVSIGTTVSTNQLNVHNQIGVTNTSLTNQPLIAWNVGSNRRFGMFLESGATSGFMTIAKYTTSGTFDGRMLRFDLDSGLIAINHTTTPAAFLDIEQGGTTPAIRIRRSTFNDWSISNTASGFRIRNESAPREALFLSQGAVAAGLFTIEPAAPLHVQGSGVASSLPTISGNIVALAARVAASSNQAFISAISGNAGISGFAMGDTDDAQRADLVYHHVSEEWRFRQSGTTRVTISGTGDVDVSGGLTVANTSTFSSTLNVLGALIPAEVRTGTFNASVTGSTAATLFTAVMHGVYLVFAHSTSAPGQNVFAIVRYDGTTVNINTISSATHSITNSGTTIQVFNGSSTRGILAQWIRIR